MTVETIAEALQRASFFLRSAGLEHPRDEAELLLVWVSGRERLQLLLSRHEPLDQDVVSAFNQALLRRAGAEPLAYITGDKEFYGMNFAVTRSVLIPRPETEFVVTSALQWARSQGWPRGEGVVGVDLGTGSGILAVTLACLLEQAQFWAIDLCPRALQVARANASRHGVAERVNFCRGDFFDALAGLDLEHHFNLIVANPPYISRKDLRGLPSTVKNFEPRLALDGGTDGLDAYRRILRELPRYLKPPAFMALELGAGQEQAVESLFRQANLFGSLSCRRDYQGRPRVLQGSA
jgi:release factor glutamine methyltransferase